MSVFCTRETRVPDAHPSRHLNAPSPIRTYQSSHYLQRSNYRTSPAPIPKTMPPTPFLNLPPVSSLFTQKKSTILSTLATPSDTYTDLSPKGSVDIGIKSLIDQINTLDGIVTTSSCAGRISVFLEGAKTKAGGGGQVAVPGGKGMGGRWLFVSHDAVDVPVRVDVEDKSLTRLFGLKPQLRDAQVVLGSEARFVKFQFEPMVSLSRFSVSSVLQTAGRWSAKRLMAQ